VAVAGKTTEQLDARANFFRIAIQKQIESPILNSLSPTYHPRAPNVLAELYFSISEAYKRLYMAPGRLTDDSKKAAFSCAAVCALKPIRCDAALIEREEFIYANQMLAMRIACSIVEHPFHKRAFDETRRFFRALQELRLPSTDPIIEEAAKLDGLFTSEWNITLTSGERSALNMLINMFSVLKDMKVYMEG
jgi:hypothetical protein